MNDETRIHATQTPTGAPSRLLLAAAGVFGFRLPRLAVPRNPKAPGGSRTAPWRPTLKEREVLPDPQTGGLGEVVLEDNASDSGREGGSVPVDSR